MPIKEQNNSFPHIPIRIKGLGELAENLWWSWQPSARMLFKMLDRQTWKETGHNPDQTLKLLPESTLQEAAQDTNYLRHYDLVMSQFRQYIKNHSLILQTGTTLQDTPPIAYFSAEYGLHHSLPFYAGGLGFLAGDHLKECSDLGIPLVAIGFMYPSGYLHQVISSTGWQENFTQVVDKEAASINRVLDENGKQLIVQVPYINSSVIHIGIWQVVVGRVRLYLLDTDIDLNDFETRKISEQLYTSNLEQRLLQEIILGIGGSLALKAMGIKHSMIHLNEGHPAFALLERTRKLIQQGLDFEQAKQKMMQTALFTTHTPVPAGHDVFPESLIDKYFKSYWPKLGLDREAFLKLGQHPERPEAGFNMSVLALKLSGYKNAVSEKHCQVTQKMWKCLWPNLSEQEVPIDYITNGIHLPTWLEPKMRLLFNKYFADGWLNEHDNYSIWEFIEEIPEDELWRTHYWLKMKLINYIRARARLRWSEDQADSSIVVAEGTLLDPAVLTIGFARRFATYKRADLLFHRLKKIKKLLNDPWRPIQIIFAGKAHPADYEGKEIIQRIFNLARNHELGGRIAFVENYNEQLAQYMVHGVDIWLNNPKPPLEASGTSGMKAALNGVPHLSILDGWWLEGYNGNNGWSFGTTEEAGDTTSQDAEDLYRILEEKIIPLYYNVAEDGTPHGWVRIMKNSIKSNASRYSARRMVKEYIEKFYNKAINIAPQTCYF